MKHTDSDRHELEDSAHYVAELADKMIQQLDVSVDDAETFPKGSPAFRVAANAYERLALAQKRADPERWKKARVAKKGKTGHDLLETLWKIREALRKR